MVCGRFEAVWVCILKNIWQMADENKEKFVWEIGKNLISRWMEQFSLHLCTFLRRILNILCKTLKNCPFLAELNWKIPKYKTRIAEKNAKITNFQSDLFWRMAPIGSYFFLKVQDFCLYFNVIIITTWRNAANFLFLNLNFCKFCKILKKFKTIWGKFQKGFLIVSDRTLKDESNDMKNIFFDALEQKLRRKM